jgi:hypothetical protein
MVRSKRNVYENAVRLLPELKRLIEGYDHMEESTDRYALNAEEEYIFTMLYKATNHIDDAVSILEQMERPVLAEGYLEKNRYGRYEINGYELTSGHLIELWIEDDEYKEGGSWFSTRIEHNGEDYYAVGRNESLEGMRARFK